MKVLILGSTGLLGQALIQEAKKRNYQVIGVARAQANICFDITEEQTLKNQIVAMEPDVIINTVAVVNLEICERNPVLAYLVNTRPSGIIANLGCQLGFYSIHISTDHYFTGDGNAQHSESSPVCLLNEYARTKYIAETLATTHSESLVLRTNIVGFRGNKANPTFVESVIANLLTGKQMTLFDDFFTSSIDVLQFSKSCFDIISRKTTGVLNLASREVSSKKTFIESLSNKLGHQLNTPKVGSVKELTTSVLRAESLGLDVTKAESILGYRLPTLSQVIDSIANQYKEGYQ